jgi:hypothetical protein
MNLSNQSVIQGVENAISRAFRDGVHYDDLLAAMNDFAAKREQQTTVAMPRITEAGGIWGVMLSNGLDGVRHADLHSAVHDFLGRLCEQSTKESTGDEQEHDPGAVFVRRWR